MKAVRTCLLLLYIYTGACWAQTAPVAKVRAMVVDGDTIPIFTLPNYIFYGNLNL